MSSHIGGGYDTHHANKGKTHRSPLGNVPASMNLHGRGDIAAAGRARWLREVQTLRAERGLTLKEAFRQASANRVSANPQYKTVTKRRLRGRRADGVDCTPGKVCPGAYDRQPAAYESAERSHRPLTQEAAQRVLREYYRQYSKETGSMKTATKAMRQNISRTRKSEAVKPCPTKEVTYIREGIPVIRKVIDRERVAECRDNWVFREGGVRRHKFQNVTGMTEHKYAGKLTPAYGRRVMRKL